MNETTDRYAGKEAPEAVQWKRDFISLATAIEEFRKKHPNVHPKLEKVLELSHHYLWSEVMNTMDIEDEIDQERNR